jgi:formylglycine-generating enzyme required for sulfatase activity
MVKKKRKLETPHTLHDWPLTHDQEALFSFDDFAATLARLIADKETKTPLTIGISGRWGTGKTTLLRRVERMLKQTDVLYDNTQPALLDFCNDEENPQARFRPCRTVWFNAWKYADEEKLLVALTRVIVQEMCQDDIVSKVLGKLLDPSYPRRDVVNTVLGWFSIKVGEAQIGLNTGKAVPTPFAEKTAMLDLFDDAFNRLMAAWVHRSLDVTKVEPDKGVLVVIIDDLDRCLPPKMVQVLEAVKLFMDKRGCIFMLGADTEIVRRAVEKQYEQAGVSGQGAGDYLEKIIQLRFELPPASYASMQALLDCEKVIDKNWGESWRLVVTGAEINPRKVKTFVNDLNLQWAMLVNSGKAEGVNRADFNNWQVLARIAPRNFLDQIRERLEDLDLRFKFVMDATRWARGEESLNATFQEYDTWRLRRVLRDLDFSAQFNAEVLDAFVHLTAPPKIEPVPEKKPAEKVPLEVHKTVKEIGILEEQDLPRKIRRGAEKGAVSFEVAPEKSTGANRIEIGGIQFIRIPAGKFLMGSKDDNSLAYDDEKPQHTLDLPAFWMAQFPLTNQEFTEFIQATGYVTTADKEGGWSPKESKFVKGVNWQHPLDSKSGLKDKDNHPVVQVSWLDAMEYCKWFNEQYKTELQDYGLTLHLPTEAQWEKAARGEYGNEWPWGNEFDQGRCNSIEGGKGGTTPVDAYPSGASPYGMLDMVGNVWEWTHTLWKGYPYKADDGRESENDSGRRVLRGGSFGYDRSLARCAYRGSSGPDDRYGYVVGFRVAVSPISPEK